jgi:hypothetical protein
MTAFNSAISWSNHSLNLPPAQPHYSGVIRLRAHVGKKAREVIAFAAPADRMIDAVLPRSASAGWPAV